MKLRKPTAPPTERHKDRKRAAKHEDARCKTCDGVGMVPAPVKGFPGWLSNVPCPTCNPDGHDWEDE